jgi:hypothetical protein
VRYQAWVLLVELIKRRFKPRFKLGFFAICADSCLSMKKRQHFDAHGVKFFSSFKVPFDRSLHLEFWSSSVHPVSRLRATHLQFNEARFCVDVFHNEAIAVNFTLV